MSRLKVALRIVGDDLDPDALTAQIGIAPTFAARKGEEVWSRGQSLTQRHGVWSFSLTERAESGAELDDALGHLLARLPEDEPLWAGLSARYEVGVFCGLYLDTENLGTDLRAATLMALATRHLTLSLDIFAAE